MQHALKARVRNGRLVLDEPTDEEREALHRSLRESIAQMHAGKLVDGADVIAKLRSRA